MRRALTAAVLAVGLAAAEAPPGAGYRVVEGWPQLPAGRPLGSAAGVGVDSRGQVLVFHRGGRTWSEPLPLDPIGPPTIAVFDGASGRLVREWGGGLFAMPHGLTVDAHDNVWLTDVALHQVFKFSPDGKLLLTLGQRGVPGADTGHFNRPTDVAVLPDGSFYVSDGYRNTRIVKFAADGTFQFQWGRRGKGPGEFDTPHAVTVDPQGRVYVADRENDRVQVFDAKGTFLAQWRDARIGRPYGLAISGERAIVADGGVQRPPERSGAAEVTLAGDVLARFGRFGAAPGDFRMAHDVAFDRTGAVYIVEIQGQRVQKFTPAR